ncbi:MAG: dUTP diphosphatase [Leptospiraceae bacterium]|nr:dUTP diphosphatase [Leptospiraceae bacterium]
METRFENLPRVRVHRRPGARLPERATPGSAGLDVCACLPPDTVINIPPGERIAVPTGLSFEIPEGYFISIRPRSGLALKQGITLPNTPATIDSDYRGELMVILMNAGSETARIEHGDRIGQLLLERSVNFEWEELKTPADQNGTERGAGGFGSTGLA